MPSFKDNIRRAAIRVLFNQPDSVLRLLAEKKFDTPRSVAGMELEPQAHLMIALANRINERLRPHVGPLRRGLIEERRRVLRALDAEAVLAAREYAFCLFPEKTLTDFLLSSLHKSGRMVSDGA